jgi:multimeric flavodoxin WrbA
MPTQKFLAQQKLLQQFAATYKTNASKRKKINILGISCSTINTDDNPPRVPSSEKILQDTLRYASKTYDVDSKVIKLRELNFDHCEANYSIDGTYCTRPCRLSQRKKEDELLGVYNLIVDRADIIVIATPLRRWSAASLYYKFIERLNCIENQKEVYGVDLMGNQVAWCIVVGAQDGVQATLGQMMSFWAHLGCSFAKHPFVWYTAGNYTNDKLDLVPAQIATDKKIIASQYQEMIDAQIALVQKLRKK